MALTFRPELLPKIISGEKSCTRRLVKEGEILSSWASKEKVRAGMKGGIFPLTVETMAACVFRGENLIPKWKVGKDYAVCVSTGKGRARKAVWYCQKCEKFCKKDEVDKNFEVVYESEKFGGDLSAIHCLCGFIKKGKVKPLRIKITAIRKEKLLDISLADVEKEGFATKCEFLTYVAQIYFPDIKEIIATCKNLDVISALSNRRIPERKESLLIDGKDWNPDVYVLEFKRCE